MISISCEIFHRCISYIILTYIYFYIHTKAHKVTRAPQCSFASLAKHPFNKYEKILPTSTITVYGWILSLQPRCKIATLYRQVLYVPKYFLCVPYYFLYPLRTILLHNLGGVLQLIWVFVRGCLQTVRSSRFRCWFSDDSTLVMSVRGLWRLLRGHWSVSLYVYIHIFIDIR